MTHAVDTDRLDPDRLDAIHEALGQWRMFARTARSTAEADQRRLGLDLLHTARQVAAGVDALTRLEQQHRRHTAILDNLRSSAIHTSQRLAHRTSSVERVVEAAARLADDPTRTTDQRLVAARVRVGAEAQVARLETAAGVASRALAETTRLLGRHARVEVELAELRAEFCELRASTERGLAVMTSAGRLLREAAEIYERAQLSAGDLRRDLHVEEAPPEPEQFERSLRATA